MELQQITSEIYAISQRLDKATKALYKLGLEKAETERVYRMKLAQEMLALRAEGMPAAMISDVARGNLSDLLFQRDAAEAKFKAAIESLEALKSQLSALQSILKYQEQI